MDILGLYTPDAATVVTLSILIIIAGLVFEALQLYRWYKEMIDCV